MASLRVAVVSRDPEVRMCAARTFDAAPATWDITLYESPPDDADVVVYGRDVPGDGVSFDPADADRVLDDVARAARTRCTVTTVTSAVGGSGATTIALHLGASLATRAPTCVVGVGDCGLAERLGIASPPPAEPDANDALVPVAPGLRALFIDDVDDVPGIVDALGERVGHVVVDAPEAALLGATDVSAAVCTLPPTLPAARRTGRLVRAFPSAPWVLVVNRLGAGGETTRSELRRVCGRPLGVDLPCCPALRDVEDDDRLLTAPWSPWARRVARLGRALENP